MLLSLFGQFAHPVGWDRGNWVKGVNVGIVNLESYKFHFIRVHDNLVQDPSNDESILFILNITAFPLTP